MLFIHSGHYQKGGWYLGAGMRKALPIFFNPVDSASQQPSKTLASRILMDFTDLRDGTSTNDAVVSNSEVCGNSSYLDK